MARIDAQKAEWTRLGVRVAAASSDPEERAVEVARPLSFPVGYGVTEADAAAIGAYTGTRQEKFIIQPSEFILAPGGVVSAAMYATAQIGRMDPEEVVRYLNSRVKPAEPPQVRFIVPPGKVV